jgi:hypothetical protein
MTPQPEDLGSDRLRGERGAAAFHDPLKAVAGRQLIDLGPGPRVDAVEDCRPQRAVVGVDSQEARSDP